MKISEVAEKTGFPSSTIRFYEKMGLIRNVKKGTDGKRTFSEEDLKWIQFIASMKNARISVEEMKSYAELFYSGNENLDERIAVTQNHKDKLLEEKRQIEVAIAFLDDKIDYYHNLKKRRSQALK